MSLRIGIDLGGTKTEGALLDTNGKFVLRERRSTPVERGYEAILDEICALVDDLENKAGHRCTVGIGTPGSISMRTGTLKNSNTVCMNGRPLQSDLEAQLGRTIRVENDANCFTLSEALDGAARGYQMVFGVIMGTGVGGGIVFNGSLHSGPHHIAGEWGHNILVHDGRECYCGRRGCVETYISGPGLTRTWIDAGGDPGTSPQQIAQRAAAGDGRARDVLHGFLDQFGRALATVINILDPDAIVLGGGVSNLNALYADGPRYIENYLFNDELQLRLLRNLHGDSSGVRGAAQLWPATARR